LLARRGGARRKQVGRQNDAKKKITTNFGLH
jgi:hypothetical protein